LYLGTYRFSWNGTSSEILKQSLSIIINLLCSAEIEIEINAKLTWHFLPIGGECTQHTHYTSTNILDNNNYYNKYFNGARKHRNLEQGCGGFWQTIKKLFRQPLRSTIRYNICILYLRYNIYVIY